MNDRDRSRLHKSKLTWFLKWAENKGYEICETKGDYEAFRIKKNKKLIIGHQRDRTDHITVHNDGIKIVNEWLGSTKKKQT